jgi:hypothetical protein
MNELFKSLGFENDPIDKAECINCGSQIEIPLFCNVGRYMPMPVWCRKCNQSYRYWRFFGCYKPDEIKRWTLAKVVSDRTNGKMIEKE